MSRSLPLVELAVDIVSPQAWFAALPGRRAARKAAIRAVGADRQGRRDH
ncbi:MAG TPA: hypothetical protein VMU56_05065 [Beijerinckiaceae bacterium]|nr:hypothetical protein [Beijerinckiaceae bacterium]